MAQYLPFWQIQMTQKYINKRPLLSWNFILPIAILTQTQIAKTNSWVYIP